MRIACVQCFPIDYCLDYVNAIASVVDVEFLASRSALIDRDSYLDPRVNLTCFDWPRHRSLANIKLLRQLAQTIRSRDVDLVHFLGNDVIWLNFLPYLIGTRPTVITVHDAEPHPGDTESALMPRFVLDRFIASGSKLVVHGEGIRQALLRRIDRLPGDFDILPHVALMRYAQLAEREALKPTPQRLGERKLLFFGRIMAYKGLSVLLDAGQIVKETVPGLKLVIAGRGPALEGLGPKLGEDHVELHDSFIPDRDVAQQFLDTELVVLPYIEASQSGILALAAAFGKPVIVSDVGEIGELVRSTGMGLVVPPGDSDALSNAIHRFLGDPALARKLGAASAAAAKGDGAMSPNVVAGLARQCYENVLSAVAPMQQRAG
ncbi:MAG: glycosyltransferase family 4 protein [Geminicoccaceae bacterium]